MTDPTTPPAPLDLDELERAFDNSELSEPDTIRSLISELRAAVEGQGWIACSERMPAAYESVLIFVPGAVGGTVRAAYRRADEGFHEKLDANGRDVHWHENEVTHWRPLPSPPVEGT